MSEEARDEQAWQDLLAQLEKYHPEELAAVDRVAAEKQRVRHHPISAENLHLTTFGEKATSTCFPPWVMTPKKIDDDFDIPAAQSLPDPDVGHAYSRTHPVLRQCCWYRDRITPQDYSAIKPALTLASCLLSEPTVLTFYTGLLEGVRTLDRPDVIEKYNNDPANKRKLHRLFHFIAQLGPYDRETLARTFRRLCAMDIYVAWGFRRFDNAHAAITQAEVNDGFAEDTTSDSTITLSEDFLIGIRYVSELEKRGYPVKVKVNEFWYKYTGTEFDQASADMRRQFYLAVTILHELTHAVWNSSA
ncbi:hypothetical protein BDV97DRAFT_399451 [Delphinella strobiligena]|nr:hypothetical protein BDV97DRAFT_399451 [Delphinella strobiligena]